MTSNLRRWIARPLRRLARRFGFEVVPHGPHSPIPELPSAESPHWWEEASLAGLRFPADDGLGWVSRLAPRFDELAPPARPPLGARLDNPYFAGLDALLLWAAVRELRPRRMLEVGCGHSTLFALGALDANDTGTMLGVDPEPRLSASVLAHPRLTLERHSAATLPLDRFLELAAGDVLSVDGSHLVRLGSDVNRIVLEVLPRLASGVVVQVHDVFLPWDYPRPWYERGTFLTEQFLLQAFLAENPRWEILAGAHALWRRHRDAVLRLAPSLDLPPDAPHGASSLWLRRIG